VAIRTIIDRQGNFVVSDCLRGTFVYDRREATGDLLFRHGERSENEIELILGYLNPGDVVIEVGSHIGTEAVPIAKAIGPSGRLFCFEPQAAAFNILCANLAVNGATNAIPFRYAVGQSNGTIAIVPSDGNGAGFDGTFSLAHRPSEIRPLHPVPLFAEDRPDLMPMVRLDDALSVNSLRLLKIDVEGLERSVLEGARGLVQRFKPIIYMEMNEPDSGDDLIEFVRGLGYSLYWHVYGMPEVTFYGETPSEVRYKEVNALAIPVGSGIKPPSDLSEIDYFDEVYFKFFPSLGVRPRHRNIALRASNGTRFEFLRSGQIKAIFGGEELVFELCRIDGRIAARSDDQRVAAVLAIQDGPIVKALQEVVSKYREFF